MRYLPITPVKGLMDRSSGQDDPKRAVNKANEKPTTLEPVSSSRRSVLLGIGAPTLAPWVDDWWPLQANEGDDSKEADSDNEDADRVSENQPDVIFYDGWEDGRHAPRWDLESPGNDASGGVDKQNSPDGGDYTLSVKHDDPSGSRLTAETEEKFRWDREWTIETLYRIDGEDLGSYQHWEIHLCDGDIIFTLGFSSYSNRESEKPYINPDGDLIDNQDGIKNTRWELGEWYRVKCYHNGSGIYRLKGWQEGTEEPSNYQAEVNGDPPDEKKYPLVLDSYVSNPARTVMDMAYIAVETGEDSKVDNGNKDEVDVDFQSCTRAEVMGTFTEGDIAFASTGFYDDGLYGNTLLEDGIKFGDDVDAPFSGRVVFEIADSSNVSEGSDEIIVEIPNYGSDGTIISGLTTDSDDYAAASITHKNPNSNSCLDKINTDKSNSSFEVSIIETNTPVDAGEYLNVTAEVKNSGSSEVTQEAELIVGHDPEVVETKSVSLGSGEQTSISMGYETPTVNNDQEFPVRVEVADETAVRSVLVYGTGNKNNQEENGSDSANFRVSSIMANTPIDSGEYLEATATIKNNGGSQDTQTIELIVGHSPEKVDSRTVTLTPNESTTVKLGYTTPTVNNDQKFPIYVESGDMGNSTTVLVYGTG